MRLGVLLRGIAILCTLLASSSFVHAQVEEALGRQLASAGALLVPGSRIALAPPPPERSPIPVAEVEAIMTRTAHAMARDWSVKPRVLAGSAGLRASLAIVHARQGMQAWQETVNATLRQEADYVLVGEMGLRSGDLSLRLSIVALEDGRVIAQTTDVTLSVRSTTVAATPRGGIGEAVRHILDTLPEARADVVIGPFVNESSGLETAAGRALADMAIEAWLASAHSVTALLRDAPPARVRRGPGPGPGFYLEGAVRLVDATQFQLVLRLWQDGALRVSRTLDLSSLALSPQLRVALTPEASRAAPIFDPLRDFVQGLGPGKLMLVALGGDTRGHYPICHATDPMTLMKECEESLIRVEMRSNNSGEVLCLSIDANANLSVILPNAYAAAPKIAPGQTLSLPDALPALPGGARMVWPALGPPSQTLLGCVLYPRIPATVIDALARSDGAQLSAETALHLRAILRDSGPIASAAALVSIVE